MRRIRATALGMTLVFGLLTGCGKKDAEPTVEETTLAADTTADTSAEPKVTEPVTTAEPTTAEPTTAEPTTAEPTTAEPTTEEELPTLDPNLTPAEAFSELEQEVLEYRIGNNYYKAVSRMKHPEDYGFPRDKLTDYRIVSYNISEKAEKAKAGKKLKAKLEMIDPKGLTDAQKLAYDKLLYEFDIDARMSEQANLVSPIAPNGETKDSIFAFGNALYLLPLETEEDLIGYQKLLEAVPLTLRESIEYMQYQLDEYGYYQLPSNIRKAVDNAVLFAQTDPKSNPLIALYEEKVRAMDLPEEIKEKYIQKHNAYVTGELSNDLMKFTRDLQKLNSSSNKTQGLCHYEGGAEYYDVMLRNLLGVEMTPQQIFDYIYGRFVANSTMFSLYGKTQPEDFKAYASGTYEVPYDRTNVAEIAGYYTKAMAQDYPMQLLPDYEISEMPALFRGGVSSAYFLPGRWDDDSPRKIEYDPQTPGFALFFDSIMVHEGFGGHMLQFACAEGNDKVTTLGNHLGYTEGWAEYVQCESSKYANLSKALVTFRSFFITYGQDIQALADIGVNGLGWSKEELQDYLANLYNISRYDSQTIYETVIARPGGSLPYSFGEKKTRDLIEAYKRAHADDLDIQEMHRKYMSIGPTSFDIVEKYFLGE